MGLILQNIGLTRGESLVYMALLKHGESTTGIIIKHAKISSGKVYEILDKLIDKGLVSYILREKTKYFQASSPDRVLEYFAKRKAKLKQQEIEFKKVLPSLLDIQKETVAEESVTVYKGFKGTQTAIQRHLDELEEGDEVLVMGATAHKPEKFNRMWQQWHRERCKKKVLCRSIYSDDGPFRKSFAQDKYMRTRVLKNITPSAINLSNNAVQILTYEENDNTVIYIKNPAIINSLKQFFESMWLLAEEK